MDKELSITLMDAKIQRDMFKRQYDQQKEESDILIERGWEINDHLGKLDVLLFGPGAKTTGQPMKEQVEIMIVKVEKSKNKMMKKADPYLKELNECAQYYQMEYDSKKLAEGTKSLSSRLTGLVDIGLSVEESETIQKSLQDIEDQFTVKHHFV